MEIIKVLNSYYFENTYIVKYLDKVIIIDPGSNVEKIVSLIDSLDYILLTHGHMDHLKGCKFLQNKYQAKVYASLLDDDYLKGRIILDPNFPKELYLDDYLDLSLFDLEGVKIIPTPGHSKGSVCFLFENEKVLFTGDTLMEGSFGRYDFPNGNLRELIASIKLLFSLDSQIKIYPGHSGESTIGHEKEFNFIKNYLI